MAATGFQSLKETGFHSNDTSDLRYPADSNSTAVNHSAMNAGGEFNQKFDFKSNQDSSFAYFNHAAHPSSHLYHHGISAAYGYHQDQTTMMDKRDQYMNGFGAASYLPPNVDINGNPIGQMTPVTAPYLIEPINNGANSNNSNNNNKFNKKSTKLPKPPPAYPKKRTGSVKLNEKESTRYERMMLNQNNNMESENVKVSKRPPKMGVDGFGNKSRMNGQSKYAAACQALNYANAATSSSSSSSSISSSSSSSSNHNNLSSMAATTSSGKRKRKRILNRSQRAEATLREKRRMLKLNKAFEDLRKVLPDYELAKNKLSRADTLKFAIEYINSMTKELLENS